MAEVSNAYPDKRVFKCTCAHPFQDQKYGVGLRYHTYATGKRVFTCTVCGKTTPIVETKSS